MPFAYSEVLAVGVRKMSPRPAPGASLSTVSGGNCGPLVAAKAGTGSSAAARESVATTRFLRITGRPLAARESNRIGRNVNQFHTANGTGSRVWEMRIPGIASDTEKRGHRHVDDPPSRQPRHSGTSPSTVESLAGSGQPRWLWLTLSTRLTTMSRMAITPGRRAFLKTCLGTAAVAAVGLPLGLATPADAAPESRRLAPLRAQSGEPRGAAGAGARHHRRRA